MSLLDHYIAHVGQNLPKKMRADIEAEIRSLLEDTLEDRAQAAGRDPDEEMILQVLAEFGSPEKVAASYLPEQYLIGPRLFPAFSLALRIGFVIAAIFSLVGLGLTLGQVGFDFGDLGQALVDGLVGFVSTMVQVLGNVVLVFTILQRALPEIKVKDKAWDPQSLKDSESADRVRPLWLVWEIALLIGVILLFNFYPQFVGVASFSNGEWTFTPLLAPSFSSYLPLLNLIWVMACILKIILLRRGRWQPVTQMFSILIDVFALVVLFAMLRGSPLVDIPSVGFFGILWAIIISVGFGLAKKLSRLFREKHIVLSVHE